MIPDWREWTSIYQAYRVLTQGVVQKYTALQLIYACENHDKLINADVLGYALSRQTHRCLWGPTYTLLVSDIGPCDAAQWSLPCPNAAVMHQTHPNDPGLVWANILMWLKQCHKPAIWELFTAPIYCDFGMAKRSSRGRTICYRAIDLLSIKLRGKGVDRNFQPETFIMSTATAAYPVLGGDDT